MAARMSVLLVTLALLGAVLAIPPNFVPVPGGRLLHSSCVHELDEAGAHIHEGDDGVILVTSANGTRQVIPPCEHAPIQARTLLPATPDWEENGWIAWALAENTAGFTSFTSKWAVPSVPPKKVGTEVIFWWNGLEPQDRSTVIQPVLQWGQAADGSGKYYAIASWWVNDAGQALYSKPIKVKPSDAILGTVSLMSNGSYTIAIQDSTSKQTGTLIYTAKKKVTYQRGYYCLESYQLSACNQYPEPKPETMPFTTVGIQAGGKPVSAKWVAGKSGQMCSEEFKVSGQNVVLSWKAK